MYNISTRFGQLNWYWYPSKFKLGTFKMGGMRVIELGPIIISYETDTSDCGHNQQWDLHDRIRFDCRETGRKYTKIGRITSV